VERWNGSRWSILRNPQVLADQLNGVSCTSSTVCIAVGLGDSARLAERWNGNRWSIQKIDFDTQDASELTGVSCSSPDSCVAVGWDAACGNGYDVRSAPVLGVWRAAPWSLTRKGCPGDGSDSQLLGVSWRRRPRAWRSARSCIAGDGRSWSRQNTYAGFEAVSCSPSIFCTAVRSTGTTGRWNGFGWSTQQSTNLGAANLSGVSCGRNGACVAVGSYYPHPAGTLLLPLAESTIAPAGGWG
jgi:hypothetical protein